MDLKKPIYFCSECKKVLDHLDDLLFIDESSHKGFCSEDCIEDFYFPIIKHYEIIEHSLRVKHHLLSERRPAEDIDQELIEEVLTSPNEVFKLSNELQETFYHFIKHYPDFSAIVVSSVYRKEASFVFLTTITKSQALLNEFRYGEMVTDWIRSGEGNDDLEDAPTIDFEPDDFGEAAVDNEDIDDEDFIFLQLLESKKSKILADVIMGRKDNDIPFEDYPGYESCFQDTLDLPDEVFEKKDNEGDVLFTYIKSFSKGMLAQDTYFYIVICLKRSDKLEHVNVYPILALPTIDMELCQNFRGGTRLSGPIKN